MRFFLVTVHVPAENLIARVAVFVEELQRYLIERKKMRVEQSMPALVRHRRPHAALSDLPAFGVKRRRDNDRLHAVFAEPGKSQHTVRQVFILRRNLETLFDEALDADRFGRAGKKALVTEFVTAHPVDLARREIRRFVGRSRSGKASFLVLAFLLPLLLPDEFKQLVGADVLVDDGAEC